METFQTSKHLKISCQKNFSFPKISDDLFLIFLVIHKKYLISSRKNSDDLLYSHLQKNIRFHPQLHKPTFASFSKFHAFQYSFLRFSTVPVQNLQLQLHNSRFTTANYILQLHKLSSVAR